MSPSGRQVLCPHAYMLFTLFSFACNSDMVNNYLSRELDPPSIGAGQGFVKFTLSLGPYTSKRKPLYM